MICDGLDRPIASCQCNQRLPRTDVSVTLGAPEIAVEDPSFLPTTMNNFPDEGFTDDDAFHAPTSNELLSRMTSEQECEGQ